MHAAEPASWVFLVIDALFFAVSVGWAMKEKNRLRSWIPPLTLLGGVIASLEEPWINAMIKLWYPADAPLVVFTLMDHHQPLYIHLVYPGFVGLGAYVTYRGLVKYPDGRMIWWTFSAIAVMDLAFELPATSIGIFHYYGNQPLQLAPNTLPLWIPFINAAGPVLGGWLVYETQSALPGAKRLLVALLPALAYAGVFGAAGWPTYTAIDSDAPSAIRVCTALVSIGLCLAIVVTVRSLLPNQVGTHKPPTPDPSRPQTTQGTEM